MYGHLKALNDSYHIRIKMFKNFTIYYSNCIHYNLNIMYKTI